MSYSIFALLLTLIFLPLSAESTDTLSTEKQAIIQKSQEDTFIFKKKEEDSEKEETDLIADHRNREQPPNLYDMNRERQRQQQWEQNQDPYLLQ